MKLIRKATLVPRGTELWVNVTLACKIIVDDELLESDEGGITTEEIARRIVADKIVYPYQRLYKAMVEQGYKLDWVDVPTFSVDVDGSDVEFEGPYSYVPRDVEWVDPFALPLLTDERIAEYALKAEGEYIDRGEWD